MAGRVAIALAAEGVYLNICAKYYFYSAKPLELMNAKLSLIRSAHTSARAGFRGEISTRWAGAPDFDYMECNASGQPFHHVDRFPTAWEREHARVGLWIRKPLQLMRECWPGTRGTFDYGFPVGGDDIVHVI